MKHIIFGLGLCSLICLSSVTFASPGFVHLANYDQNSSSIYTKLVVDVNSNSTAKTNDGDETSADTTDNSTTDDETATNGSNNQDQENNDSSDDEQSSISENDEDSSSEDTSSNVDE